MTEKSSPRTSRSRSKSGKANSPKDGKSQNSTSSSKTKLTPEFEEELASINAEIKEKGIQIMSEDEFAAFGGLDFDDIPEAINRGKYKCELTEARLNDVTKETDDVKYGRKLWVLTFAVSEDMTYMGESASLFMNLYTSKDIHQDPVTRQIMYGDEHIDSEQQQRIRDALKFYRKTAIELGFTKDQVRAGAIDFNKMVNKEYMVSLYSDNNKKTRVSQQDPITSVEEAEGNVATLDSLQSI